MYREEKYIPFSLGVSARDSDVFLDFSSKPQSRNDLLRV